MLWFGCFDVIVTVQLKSTEMVVFERERLLSVFEIHFFKILFADNCFGGYLYLIEKDYLHYYLLGRCFLECRGES